MTGAQTDYSVFINRVFTFTTHYVLLAVSAVYGLFPDGRMWQFKVAFKLKNGLTRYS